MGALPRRENVVVVKLRLVAGTRVSIGGIGGIGGVGGVWGTELLYGSKFS